MITARQILQAEYGNAPNFMTPDVLRTIKLSDTVAVELSKGLGFRQDPIYGVSFAVLRPDGTSRRGGMKVNQCFHNIPAALRHIARVQALLPTG